MAYVAARSLRWGDETLQPGDPVPEDEPGRDYAGMLHLGEIREVDGDSAEHDLRQQLKDAKARIKELESGTELPEGPHLILTLSDEQQAKLAELGVEGTVSFDDLDAALAGDEDDEPTGEDALPDGVVDLGSGWYQLPDGVTVDGKNKVSGREALDAALAGKTE